MHASNPENSNQHINYHCSIHSGTLRGPVIVILDFIPTWNRR